jgi:DNA modification methylase
VIELPTETEPVRAVCGDSLVELPTLPECSVDSIVTDPPYGIGFMGKEWDSFSPEGTRARVARKRRKKTEVPVGSHGRPGELASSGIEYDLSRDGNARFQCWCQNLATVCLRVLKPGGYMAVFGGTRTYHRLACAVEDAGFEIRDCLMWLYGSGFPKGDGNLKPGWEPILLARKPGKRVLPLQVDACRIPCETRPNITSKPKNGAFAGVFREGSSADGTTTLGRYPANVVHDGSDEVLEAFAAFGERGGQDKRPVLNRAKRRPGEPGKVNKEGRSESVLYGDSGTAARFFYCAKASRAERNAGVNGPDKALLWSAGTQSPGTFQSEGTKRAAKNNHPTVKPVALMRWLVRLLTPPRGIVLDPCAGSGTTLVACAIEGLKAVGVEQESEHAEVARQRVAHARRQPGLFDDFTADEETAA